MYVYIYIYTYNSTHSQYTQIHTLLHAHAHTRTDAHTFMHTHARASAYARTTRLRPKATRKDTVQLYLRRQRKRSSSKASHFICWKKTTQNTAHHHTISPFDTHSAVHSADATTRGPLYGRQPDHDRPATRPLTCSPPQPADKTRTNFPPSGCKSSCMCCRTQLLALRIVERCAIQHNSWRPPLR